MGDRAWSVILGSAMTAWVACSSSSGANGSSGAQGPPGPQGPPGTSVAPSLAGVFPRTFLLDRELDVVILGDATTFTGTEAPDFGPGVGVFAVTALSPTALSAHLKIDKGAAVGVRDVHVGSLSAAKMVEVAPAMEVSVLAGTPRQGSLAVLDLINRDTNQAFDTGFGLTPDPAIGIGVI